MEKPSLGYLLTSSGYKSFSFDSFLRAAHSLYGNIGAGLDTRNWSAIMASADPLKASEQALAAMYQDRQYLLTNARHLTGTSYSIYAVELTYRQVYERLGLTYSSDWSLGTTFAEASSLTRAQLEAAAASAYKDSLANPTLSVSFSGTGFTVNLSETGTLTLSVDGSIGAFGAGTSTLTERAAISTGTLTLTSSTSQKTSAATTQTFVLGTTGADTIDTTAAGARVDYVFGGAGDDVILSGAGADVLIGGTGGDRLTAGAGDDTVHAGTGWDTITGGAGTDHLYLNAGVLEMETVILDINNDGADVIDGFHFGGGTGGNGFDRMDLTAPTGLALIGGAANSLTNNANGGNGTTADNFAADTAPDPGGFVPTVSTLYKIGVGADQLGAGTTVANATARAVTQLSDGAEDFLLRTTGANQGGLVLITDDGTHQFLFLVYDANNNRTTDAGEVVLVAQFSNSTGIANMTMTDFNA